MNGPITGNRCIDPVAHTIWTQHRAKTYRLIADQAAKL